MLNPVHLRTLGAVLRTGSFAAAAKQLGYTPSAVSQQIAALERDTRLALFERGARAVRPTPAAQTLVSRAGEALAVLDALEDDVRALAGGRLGRLRLGSFPTASEHLLPGALARLADRLPGVGTVLEEGEPEALLPLVTDRQTDLALVYEYDLAPRAWPRNLVRTVLLTEDVLLLLPSGHRLARPGTALADLGREVWISTAEGTGGAESLRRACGAAGFVPRIDHRTNDYDVVRRLVAAGLGIALVPALGHEPSPGVTAVLPRDPAVRRRVIAVHRRVGANPAVGEALDACRHAAEAAAAEHPGCHRP